jgi:hypothetical protein
VAKPHLISTLDELPSLETLGLVIGIDTRIFTTLAVASAARHLPIPLLIVDGYSNDGSFEALRELDLPVESWLIRMERRIHGVFIDKFVRELKTERLLLIDSDVEVEASTAFNAMTTALSAAIAEGNDAFAAGCSHGDHTMENDGMPHAWFSRRPWIPFVLLDRARCAALLDAGATFEVKFVGNELPLQGLANLLAKRAHFGFSKPWRFRFLTPLRRMRRGVRSALYVYDTGGLVFETAERHGLRFAEIGWDTMNASVVHYDGATRSAEARRWVGATEAEQRLLATLKNSYRIELPH